MKARRTIAVAGMIGVMTGVVRRRAIRRNQVEAAVIAESEAVSRKAPVWINLDRMVGAGMAVVMLVAMAGWLYGLGWLAWRLFLRLTS